MVWKCKFMEVKDLPATNIYFVRHAQSDQSVREDAFRPLTPKGLEDARKIIAVLNRLKIHKVLSSPYLRTMDTVKPFADSIGQSIEAVDGFRERNVGGWVEDFRDFSRKQWDNFHFKLEGGECLSEVQERNISALLHIKEKYKEMNLVIGTHGTALGTIMNYYDAGFGYDSFWSLVDRMPYIMHVQFGDGDLVKMEDIEIGNSDARL